MGVRNEHNRVKSEPIEKDFDTVLKKAKVYYRPCKQFLIYTVHIGESVWYAAGYATTDHKPLPDTTKKYAFINGRWKETPHTDIDGYHNTIMEPGIDFCKSCMSTNLWGPMEEDGKWNTYCNQCGMKQ